MKKGFAHVYLAIAYGTNATFSIVSQNHENFDFLFLNFCFKKSRPAKVPRGNLESRLRDPKYYFTLAKVTKVYF